MTETPKCPYCGAEMKVDAVRLTQHNWVGWSHCENCRSVGPSKSNCYTEKEAEEAALSAALHRAEPELRPLTLEEVKSHCAKGPDAEPLYIEFSHRTTLSRWILVSPNIECNEPATVTRYLDIWEHDYGKTWRCWPRKPTPEQMAAEWEEEEKDG